MTMSDVGKRFPTDTPFATPRKRFPRWARVLITIGVVLFLLLLLFGFNPLHPIWSIHQIETNFAAGERDAGLAKERERVRERAEERAQERAREAAEHAHTSAASPSQPTTTTP